MAQAKSAGLDTTVILNTTSIDRQEVTKDMKEFRSKYPLKGVLFFIFDRKYTMSGLQLPIKLLTVFEELING